MTAGSSGGLSVYRRLLSYSLRYRRQFLLAVLGMIVYAATDTGFAALIKTLLDGSFVRRDPDLVRWMPLALVGVLLVRGLGSYLSTYFLHFVGRGVIKRLREEMFERLLRAPVAFFDAVSSGQLISRITFDTEQVFEAATKGATLLVRDSLTILGLLIWMFYLDWRLALAFFAVAPLVAFTVNYVTRMFRRVSHRIQDSMGDITHIAEETVEGIRVIKIFSGYDYERRRFHTANEQNRRMGVRWAAIQAASAPVMQLILGVALAVIVGLALHAGEAVSVGGFVSFVVAMALMMAPVQRLSKVNAVIQKGVAAGQSAFSVIDGPREHEGAGRALERAQGRLRYEHVHFAYDPDKGEVLRDVSFEARPGETVALVGRSGSGKSTLASLLPRFYEPTRGCIRLDGEDIRDIRLRDLRRQISYVGQDTVLFNDTVAANIAYGTNGEVSAERLRAVAEAAHALEFIERLPEGFDTRVGENGVLLSGGQRQRIAIARALLKDAPILILDEATSSLDTQAERHIQEALERLVAQRTTLVIAHRLSTIERADRILVLEAGRIVESGRHEELLSRGGRYASLYQSQLQP